MCPVDKCFFLRFYTDGESKIFRQFKKFFLLDDEHVKVGYENKFNMSIIKFIRVFQSIDIFQN